MQTCGVVWCRNIAELKAGTTDEAFEEGVFCGKEELLLGQTFFDLKDLSREQEHLYIKH